MTVVVQLIQVGAANTGRVLGIKPNARPPGVNGPGRRFGDKPEGGVKVAPIHSTITGQSQQGLILLLHGLISQPQRFFGLLALGDVA